MELTAKREDPTFDLERIKAAENELNGIKTEIE
jgi:hypothetical protein